MSTYKDKYIKYKKKYLTLKNKMKGGSDANLKKVLKASEKSLEEDKKIQTTISQRNRRIKKKTEKPKHSLVSNLFNLLSKSLRTLRSYITYSEKNLDDIKKFNDVPGDGFCGYWCIYNALYNPVNLRTKARPYFQIGILDKDFRNWLMSTLQIIRNNHNGHNIKEVIKFT